MILLEKKGTLQSQRQARQVQQVGCGLSLRENWGQIGTLVGNKGICCSWKKGPFVLKIDICASLFLQSYQQQMPVWWW